MYERSQVSKVTTVVNIELPGSEKMYRSMDVVNDRSNSIQQINIIITMFSSICQVGWKRPFCKVGNELCKKSGRREREREHLLCICLILKYTLSAMIGCFSWKDPYHRLYFLLSSHFHNRYILPRGERIIRYSNNICIVETEQWYSYSADIFKPNNIRIRMISQYRIYLYLLRMEGAIWSELMLRSSPQAGWKSQRLVLEGFILVGDLCVYCN